MAAAARRLPSATGWPGCVPCVRRSKKNANLGLRPDGPGWGPFARKATGRHQREQGDSARRTIVSWRPNPRKAAVVVVGIVEFALCTADNPPCPPCAGTRRDHSVFAIIACRLARKQTLSVLESGPILAEWERTLALDSSQRLQCFRRQFVQRDDRQPVDPGGRAARRSRWNRRSGRCRRGGHWCGSRCRRGGNRRGGRRQRRG